MKIYCIGLICLCVLFRNTVQAQEYTLADCEQLAIRNNYRLKTTRLDIDAASQTRKEAFTHYFPTVETSGTYFNSNRGLFRTTVETGGFVTPELAAALGPELLGVLPEAIGVSMLKNGILGAATATQPVFAGGRIVNSNKLARVGEEASQLQLQLTTDEVILRTHTYFWQIVNLKEKLETITLVESLLNNLLKDVGTAVDAGVTTRNDLLRVELQIHEVQSDRLKVENGLKISRMVLAQFIGAEAEGFHIAYQPTEDYRNPLSVYQPAETAVWERNETLLLDRNVEASRLKTRISSGQRLPSVGVGGGYLYNNLGGSGKNNGIVFASVTVPISGWWGGSHSHKRHLIAQRQAEIERTDAIQRMTVEINSVWNEVIEAHEQIRIAENSIRSASENLRIVNNTYRAGTVPLSELLDAQVLFQQSRNQYSDAFTDYQVKILKYRQITGNR